MLGHWLNAAWTLISLVVLCLFGVSVWIIMPLALVIGMILGAVLVMWRLDVGSDM